MEAAAESPAASRGRANAPAAGDPVDVTTGEVLFSQADVALPGTLPLVLERSHRSAHRTGRWLGPSWMSSFDQRLRVTEDKVIGAFDGGRILTWSRSQADVIALLNHPEGALPESGPAWRLGQDGTGWTVSDPQTGRVWRFEHRAGYWQANDGRGELPLVSLSDRAGHVIRFEYGNAGEPVAAVHSGGYRVEVAVQDGRITGLALAARDGGAAMPLVGYTYDSDRRLSGVANSSGLPLRFTYDHDGRLAGWTDRAGHSYSYVYDQEGRCVRGKSPSGMQSSTFEYEPGITRHTDAEGAVTVYEIDDSYRVTVTTDPLGAVSRVAYDERDNVTERTDPLGRATRFDRDEAGNLTQVTLPDGTVARAQYDERCLPVEVTGLDETVWRQSFDERGNRVEAVSPDGAVTRFGYDEAGHLAAVTEPDGATTRVTCDATGLPRVVTGPDGRIVSYERDSSGRITRVTGPDGSSTEAGWSPEGLPVFRIMPDGTTETWEWDPDGHLARHTAPSGAITSFEYGPFDLTTAVTGPDGTRTEFAYDRELRLTSVTRGGLIWRYELDAAGRRIAETDFNGATTRYRHDAAGQLTSKVNAAGQETSYTYSPCGNMIGLSADGEATTLAYDAAGRLVRARNADADVAITRDALGRIIAEAINGRVLRTEYDAAGRVMRRTTPSGSVTDWAYNAAGLPETMTSTGRELRFGYDQAGQETIRHLPGGTVLAQAWDAVGRLAGQTVTGPGRAPGPEGPAVPGEVLQRRTYAYSDDGFLTGAEDLLNGNRAFGLDASGRVTAVTGGQWSERYSYDVLGGIISAAWPTMPDGWLDGTGQGTREVAGTRVTRAGNIRYRYDAAGRVMSRTRIRISRKPETWHYSWDADSRLTMVTVPDGTTWRYRYDAFGRRIAKQHFDADGQVLEETRFAWDGMTLAEQTGLTPDGEHHTTWDYEPGTFTPLAQQTGTRLRDAPQDEIDRRFHAIITDLAGTPRELVSDDGALAGHRQATLWGGTAWATDGESTPIRFPGQYEDPETGLHQNGHRYYDPVTGNYLSPDPLGLVPSSHPYSYVPNPHVLADPLGLEPGTLTRNAPDFIGDPSGSTADVREIGRPDNQLVLSGHGGIRAGDEATVTVPPGTAISMYSHHGEPISDHLGNQIETANPTPVEVFHSGDKLPDYNLYPPDNLNILGLPRNVTVTRPTRLSELMQPNMGSIHWAACRSVIGKH